MNCTISLESSPLTLHLTLLKILIDYSSFILAYATRDHSHVVVRLSMGQQVNQSRHCLDAFKNRFQDVNLHNQLELQMGVFSLGAYNIVSIKPFTLSSTTETH